MPSSSSSSPSSSLLQLNSDQQRVVDLIRQGHNVCIQAMPGTGKTTVLQHIIDTWVHDDTTLSVTASTGTAAVVIDRPNTQTLHRLCGLSRPKSGRPQQMMEVVRRATYYIRRQPGRLQAIKRCRLLIIDEMSMLHPVHAFDAASRVFRSIRNSPMPFGGVQVLLSGDFGQLPFVDRRGNTPLLFDHPLWASLRFRCVSLRHSFRQQTCPELTTLIQDLRHGQLSLESERLIQQLDRNSSFSSSSPPPTYLVNHVKTAQTINRRHMAKLDRRRYEFRSVVVVSPPDKQMKPTNNNKLGPVTLRLCVGCRVSLTFNLHVGHKLCNGSTGIVQAFRTPTEEDLKQWPTPTTVDCSVSSDHVFPVVAFDNGQRVLVLPTPESSATYTLPLLLAWAMTVHRSQGQTRTNNVVVDFNYKCFAPGQAVTAISRVCHYRQLTIRRFCRRRCVRVNKRAAAFIRQVEEAQCIDGDDDKRKCVVFESLQQ